MADPTTLPFPAHPCRWFNGRCIDCGRAYGERGIQALDDCECSAITTTEQVAAMYEEVSDLQAKQPDSGRLG